MSANLSYQEYLDLIVEVNRLRNEVHLFNVEEISEAALDDLKHKITLFEEQNPDKISSNSPNYTIAGGVAKGFTKYEHHRRMLSLTDIFSLEELQDWENRWVKLTQKDEQSIQKINQSETNNNDLLTLNPENIDIKSETDKGHLQITGTTEKDTDQVKMNSNQSKYICEPKIDGLAISLHYQNGSLVAAATRGDGWVGELVTENIKQVHNIPKNITDPRKLEVRGEIFMTKKDFLELNTDILAGKKIGKMGKTGPEGVFANPRNASSGTVRQLDSRIVGERNLSFIAYGIYVEENIS